MSKGLSRSGQYLAGLMGSERVTVGLDISKYLSGSQWIHASLGWSHGASAS